MPNPDGSKITLPLQSGTTNLQTGPEGGDLAMDSSDSREVKYNQSGNIRTVMNLEAAQTVSGVKTFSATPVMSSGALTVKGAEAGDAVINIQADEGDDTADQWSVTALAASATVEVANAGTAAAKFTLTPNTLSVIAAADANAGLVLDADKGDDNADTWTIQSTTADNDLDFINHTSTVASLTSAGVFSSVGLTNTGACLGLRRDVSVTSAVGPTALAAADSGKVYICTAASGTQTFTLPTAATAGLVFTFVAGHADGEILVNPQTGQTISIKASEGGASVVTASGTGIKNTAASNVLNDHITLVSNGTSAWYMIAQSGTWASQ